MKWTKNNIMGIEFKHESELSNSKIWKIGIKEGNQYSILDIGNHHQCYYFLDDIIRYLNEGIWVVVSKSPILNSSYGKLKFIFL